MNILIPDSWLREFLKTNATPAQIKDYLSLCGPSVERIDKQGKETVYVIEVTSNRPDSMSVSGIAREAAAILPRFDITATFVNNPYDIKKAKLPAAKGKKLIIKTDFSLNPRFTAVVIEDVRIAPSPAWMKQRLEASGIRPLNNVVDITNWLMRAYGQPAHAFDYDAIAGKNGGATMVLRASKKGEKIKTLDGKTHTLPGGDIVIEDAKGRLIDLCGIMGAKNSAIQESTNTVILFMQTYDATHIRKTSMALAHRTEAASLFEKGVDSELVAPTIIKGIALMSELTGGTVASPMYDLYPKPFRPYTAIVARKKISSYMGSDLSPHEATALLTPLGFVPKITKDTLAVTVPSFRRDVALDVDIIEELARLKGYHNIAPTLPASAPPVTIPDPTLAWERETKVRLRDWGFTELYTYSMISDDLMDAFGLDKKKAYKIANPLSGDWVYMRPHLFPSVLAAVAHNLKIKEYLKVFELSMAYKWQKGDLPHEAPTLIIVWTKDAFLEAKGLAQAIFELFGIPFPQDVENKAEQPLGWYTNKRLFLGQYGSLGVLAPELLSKVGIHTPVTRIYMDFEKLAAHASPGKKYVPAPKYPPIVEDFTFTVNAGVYIAPLLRELMDAHPLVANAALHDVYENTRTIRVWFQSPKRNLTDHDVVPAREAVIKKAAEKNALLKTP